MLFGPLWIYACRSSRLFWNNGSWAKEGPLGFFPKTANLRSSTSSLHKLKQPENREEHGLETFGKEVLKMEFVEDFPVGVIFKSLVIYKTLRKLRTFGKQSWKSSLQKILSL